MKKFITSTIAVTALILVYSVAALAGTGDFTPGRILTTVEGTTYIAVSPIPKSVCTSGGSQFKFNAATPGGKAMQATLLSAKLTNKKVTLWWTEIPAGLAGSTNCGEPEMAQVASIAIE